MPEPVPVRVRDCACPGQPHADEGDLVYLAPRLTLELGTAAAAHFYEYAPKGDTAGLTAAWFRDYIVYGVRGANFEPFSTQMLLDDYDLGSPVAEVANDLYAEAVLRPLGMSLPSSPSPGGPTEG